MINTEGREPGDKTRKPGFYRVVDRLGRETIAQWVIAEDGGSNFWSRPQVSGVFDYDFREIDERPINRTASTGETQEQLIAVIMKITPNRTALRKFMRAMCLEFDKRKPEPNT